MSISTINSPTHHQQFTPKQPADSQSFSQFSASQKVSTISLTTAEGDKVTFSSNSAEILAITGQSNYHPSEAGQPTMRGLQRLTAQNDLDFHSNNFSGMTAMTYSAASLRQEGLAFSVQGDLNEEELADIAAIYDDLANIASSFYSGDYAGAMTGALAIGDMGSISQLNASFSYQKISASQLTSHHVMPSPTAPDLPQAFADLPTPELLANAATNNPGNLIKAQWQQIEDFLAQQDQQSEPTSQSAEKQPNDNVGKNPAQQMLARLNDLVSTHPRLAPFSLPLAHRALDHMANQRPNSPQIKQTVPLKNALLQEFQRWLAA